MNNVSFLVGFESGEADRPVLGGKEGVVLAHSDTLSGAEFHSSLSDQNVSGLGVLSRKEFDPQPPSDRIASVVGRPTRLFGSHAPNSPHSIVNNRTSCSSCCCIIHCSALDSRSIAIDVSLQQHRCCQSRRRHCHCRLSRGHQLKDKRLSFTQATNASSLRHITHQNRDNGHTGGDGQMGRKL